LGNRIGGDVPGITLSGVSVVYAGGRTALQPTTLGFSGGQFVVLLGPSGAGKSTLLRTLNGLVRPTTGRVAVESVGDLAEPAHLRAHRRRTAMVFQQHQLIGRLSALRNVLLGRLGYHSGWRSLFPLPLEDQFIALESLEKVGIADRALDRADTLSGGQQQRVGVARALAQQPAFMLADEPVASLDPTAARGALSLLRDICKSDGIAMVVSLHQVDFAREFADRIVGLSRGQVVFDGTVDQLTESHLGRIYDRPSPSGGTEIAATSFSLAPLTAEFRA